MRYFMILIDFLITTDGNVDIGILEEWSDEFFKKIMGDTIVTIHETYKLATGQFESLISGDRDTGIRLAVDSNAWVGLVGFEEFCGLIGGTIINDNDFKVLKSLHQKRVDAVC